MRWAPGPTEGEPVAARRRSLGRWSSNASAGISVRGGDEGADTDVVDRIHERPIVAVHHEPDVSKRDVVNDVERGVSRMVMLDDRLVGRRVEAAERTSRAEVVVLGDEECSVFEWKKTASPGSASNVTVSNRASSFSTRSTSAPVWPP